VRNAESLRNKFKQLRNSLKPTGDPHFPQSIKEAKRINRLINSSSDVITLGGDEDGDGEEEQQDVVEDGVDEPTMASWSKWTKNMSTKTLITLRHRLLALRPSEEGQLLLNPNPQNLPLLLPPRVLT